MKILSHSKKCKDKIVLCLGYFESIHKGHLEIIKSARQYCKQNSCKLALMTFKQNPTSVIFNTQNKEIFTFSERKEIYKNLKIDYCWPINFTKKIQHIEYDKFEDMIKEKFSNIEKLFCGVDFTYGYMGKGNINTLIQKFQVEIIESIEDNYEKISSSYIKKLLLKGEIEKINSLLYKNYFINGKVIHGNHISRNLGFKTANISIDKNKFLVKNGVLITEVQICEKKYLAATCISTSPTLLPNNTLITVESHLLNFHDDIYDENVRIIFKKWIRDIEIFKNKEKLINKIKDDIKEVEKYGKNTN